MLKDTCKTCYSEVYIAYIHLKVTCPIYFWLINKGFEICCWYCNEIRNERGC